MKLKQTKILEYLDIIVLIGLILLFFSLPFESQFNSLFVVAQLVAFLAITARILIKNGKDFVIKVITQFVVVLSGIGLVSMVFLWSTGLLVLTIFLKQVGAGLFILLVLLNDDSGWLSKGPIPKWLKSLVFYSALAFFIVALLSSLFSVSAAVSFRLMRKELGAYFLLFLLLLNYVDSMKKLKQIVLIIYLVGLVIAFLGVGEWLVYRTGHYPIKRFFLVHDVVHELYLGISIPVQIQFPFGEHNRMASFLLIIAAVVLLQYYLTIKRVSRHWIEVSFFFPLAGLLFTLHRVAFIALIFSLFIFFLLTHRRNLLIIPILLVGVYALSSPETKEHYVSIFQRNSDDKSKTSEIDQQLRVCSRSLKIIGDHWWLGIGYGWPNFAQIKPTYNLDEVAPDFSHCHNNLVEIAVETGLAGALSFLIFQLFLLVVLLNNFFNHPVQSNIRRITAGFIAIWIAIFLYGLFDYSLRYTVGMLIWAMFALSLAFVKLAEQIEYE